MRFSQPCCLLLLVIFSVTIAVGDEPPAPGWFTKLDRDANGSLDSTEAGRFVAEMDADEDGVVTVDDAIAFAEYPTRYLGVSLPRAG